MIVNITTTSGTDFIYSFAYLVAPAGAGIDITGCTLQMMVRSTVEDTNVYINLSSNLNGGILINVPASGLFSIKITKEQLEELSAATYAQNLTITWPDDHTDEVWHGVLIHTIGATR